MYSLTKYTFFVQDTLVDEDTFLSINKKKFNSELEAIKCLNIAKYQLYLVDVYNRLELIHSEADETFILLEDWNVRWYFHYVNGIYCFYKVV